MINSFDPDMIFVLYGFSINIARMCSEKDRSEQKIKMRFSDVNVNPSSKYLFTREPCVMINHVMQGVPPPQTQRELLALLNIADE